MLRITRLALTLLLPLLLRLVVLVLARAIVCNVTCFLLYPSDPSTIFSVVSSVGCGDMRKKKGNQMAEKGARKNTTAPMLPKNKVGRRGLRSSAKATFHLICHL